MTYLLLPNLPFVLVLVSTGAVSVVVVDALF